ncbi:penicillin acylase family protein [Pseudokordiimonas caeni]|uniref:penicillin acylase family protein n=1 Tax=Pseudokordiimonas caeni TaxID=2997908 RepID=UPI0028120D9F|nr:penicillin acylase family protein [Pseudokordiimonas caeni]
MTTRSRYPVAALVPALLVWGLFWIVATGPKPVPADRYLDLADRYDVEIIRDDYGVPHIYGARDVDVAFGLAFAHAEDDFPTIQDVVLATRGMLAAEKGPSAAPADFLVGFMDVKRTVEKGYATKVSAEARALAEAYADGINHYAATHPGEASSLLLPVKGEDVVAGFTFKTPLFYGFDKAISALFAGTYPGMPSSAQPEEEEESLPVGSQGVALAPKATTDGHTRLLVNSHQPLTGPVAWYEARVKSEEGWDMVGGTFPGAPLILHGAGPDLGWANTVNTPDLVDVFRIRRHPGGALAYTLDNKWAPMTARTVPIRVKLWGPFYWTVERTVYETLFGPVVEVNGDYYAVRFAGYRELGMLDAMYALNKAKDRAAFEAALARGSLPSLNYVMATASGDVAHYYNAQFPKRPNVPGLDWRKLVPGDQSSIFVEGYEPFSAVPKTVNPESGIVFNANNSPYLATTGAGAPVPDDFPARLGVQGNLTNRALRLNRLLTLAAPVSPDAFREIKYDKVFDPSYPPLVALRTALLEPPVWLGVEEREGVDLLRRWRGGTALDDRSAALGIALLYPMIKAWEADEPMPDVWGRLPVALNYLVTRFGRIDPEWGEVSRLRRGGIDLPIAGGPDILRAVYGERDADGRMRDVAGDSYILFADWDGKGGFTARSAHSFGAAAGRPDSPHHTDQMDMFVREEEREVPLDREALMAEKTSSRRL